MIDKTVEAGATFDYFTPIISLGRLVFGGTVKIVVHRDEQVDVDMILAANNIWHSAGMLYGEEYRFDVRRRDREIVSELLGVQ